MKTFEEFLLQEATYKSFHKDSPDDAAELHKKVLKSGGDEIVSHEKDEDGDHRIISKSKDGKVRVHDIMKSADSKKGKSFISNRPASDAEQKKYGGSKK